MSKPLLEFVPNFSEGRDAAKVDAIVSAMTAVPGVRLLDREMDASHHRAVITLAGAADAIEQAAFRGCREAIARIDLRQHKGEHKRMGAMDVCPFVPLRGATMQLAIQTANEVGARIGNELSLPVYLYAAAARREDRRVLGNVRNLEFEALSERVGKEVGLAPDYGPNRMHPTAGAVAVGARSFLIAYNVNLETPDVAIAKRIAKAVRERDGGLKAVQAMGFFLEGPQLAQVSMNLLDHTVTSVRRVFDEVAARAQAEGVAVHESELVGLIPAAAIDEDTARHVRLRGFDRGRQVIEERLQAEGVA
jgi:glutamate formiminotransferase